jgi:hypothetical protein
MNPHNPDCQLRRALEEFEVSLVTPIVGGEFDDWMDRVQQTWTEASGQIDYHVTQLHPRHFQEIEKADPEMLPRVEQLTLEDDAIEQERDELNRLVVRLTEVAPQVEPDERRIENPTDLLAKYGIDFITRVRKQEVALQTWYVEAFSRDRGVAD